LNARAEFLSAQLNELQTAIKEMRWYMEAVHNEHDKVSCATQSVE
jgi:hypothetical protein